MPESKIPEDWSDVTWDFVVKVTRYVPGSVGWIARQQHNHEWTNTWGFIIDERFGSADLDEMRGADDTFVRKVATEMLGYAPDSEQDLTVRKSAAQSEIDAIMKRIDVELASLITHQRIRDNLESKLSKLQNQQVSE